MKTIKQLVDDLLINRPTTLLDNLDGLPLIQKRSSYDEPMKSGGVRTCNQFSLNFNEFCLAYESHPIITFGLNYQNYRIFLKGQTSSQTLSNIFEEKSISSKGFTIPANNTNPKLLYNATLFRTWSFTQISLNDLMLATNMNAKANQSSMLNLYSIYRLFLVIKTQISTQNYSLFKIIKIKNQGLFNFKSLPLHLYPNKIKSDEILANRLTKNLYRSKIKRYIKKAKQKALKSDLNEISLILNSFMNNKIIPYIKYYESIFNMFVSQLLNVDYDIVEIWNVEFKTAILQLWIYINKYPGWQNIDVQYILGKYSVSKYPYFKDLYQ